VIFLTNAHTFPQVYNVLAQREGKTVTLPTIVTLTGLTATQVQNAIAGARRSNPLHAEQIKVVQAGRAWKYKVNPRVNDGDNVEEIVKAVEMGAPHIWKAVLKALHDAPGQVLTREEIVNRVGKINDEKELTPIQVANAMDTILRNVSLAPNIQVVWARRSWCFRPPAGEKTKSTTPEHSTVSPSIRNSVLRHFMQKPGDTLFVEDIAQELGFTRKQVQNAVYNLVNDPKSSVRDDFNVVTSGSAWRYRPNRAAVNGQVIPVLEKAPAHTHVAVAEKFEPATAPVATTTLPLRTTSTLPLSSKVPNIPPAGSTAARLFEEIGQASNGDILVQEADSKKIYRATEL
jgi:hypothetical protein